MGHGMSRRGRWVAGAAAILLLALAGGGAWFQRATRPPAPSAFYAPPDPLPAGRPGTVLRREPLPDALPEGAVAWRILYLSTAEDGRPVPVTAVVTAPRAPAAAPRPVIAWAHGSVGVLPGCGVGHTREPYRQTPVVDLMVRRGFVVVATDYPGLGTPGVHPYLMGEVSARAVLDAVRAARSLEVAAGDRFAVWGASQGGQAALWTAERASAYAPELTLVAAAASAPAIDLAGIIRAKRDDPGGGVFLAQALYAWSHAYPGADLDRVVRPERRAQVERIARTCLTTPLAFLTVGELPTPADYLRTDPVETEPWRTILRANTPRGPLPVPLLLTHGTDDTLIPLALTEADAARRCAAGEDVQLVRLPGVGHDARDASGVLTVGWIEDRFAGRPTTPSCGAR